MAKVALRKIVKTLDRTPAVRGIADRENNVLAGRVDRLDAPVRVDC